MIKDELVPKYVERISSMIDSGDEKLEIVGMDKMLHILEYFAPKLSRAEVKNEGEMGLTIKKEIVDGRD
jgi:type I restriction-modification system DNA methylase subunit